MDLKGLESAQTKHVQHRTTILLRLPEIDDEECQEATTCLRTFINVQKEDTLDTLWSI